MPAPLVIFWSLLGAAVGALVAALVARRQFAATRRDHGLQLRRRDAAVERLKKELGDHRRQLERQVADQRREISALRLERSSLAGDLGQTRLTLSTLQSNLDTLRASARESEARLTAALDAARQESATHRMAAAEELAAAQANGQRIRGELLNRIAQLENDRARLESARAQLESEVARLENDRARLENELATERRENAEEQEALGSIVSTLREQYSVACAEREALEREVGEYRARVGGIAASPTSRSRPADLPPEPESLPVASGIGGCGGTRPLIGDREVRPRRPYAAGSVCADDYDIERELSDSAWLSSPRARAGGSATSAMPAAPDMSTLPATPEMPASFAMRAEPRPVGGYPGAALPAAGQPHFSGAIPVEPTPADSRPGWRPMPPPASGSTRVRRPVSVVRREDDILVICDDGSVWSKRATGWTEEPSIPGSEALPGARTAGDAGDEGGAGRRAVYDGGSGRRAVHERDAEGDAPAN